MSPARIHAQSAIDLVERAYRLDGTEHEWLSELLTIAHRDLDTGHGVYAFTGSDPVPNLAATPVFAEREVPPAFLQRLQELNRDAPNAIYDLLRTRLVTCGGLEQVLGADSPVVEHFRQLMTPAGVRDGFCLFAQDAEGGSITLSAPAREAVAPAPRVRGVWQRIGLHVASALRLRRKLAQCATERDALLAPNGTFEDAANHLRDDPSARDALTRAVHAMERARRADLRSSPEHALSLWQGLVAGEWSLVDHWERGGRRYVAAYRNRPNLRDPRALTRTEATVVKLLALGASNKEIAYMLGLPTGTVATSVAQILRKFRLANRVQLATLFDAPLGDRFDIDVGEQALGVLAVEPRADREAGLTPAEREVATAAAHGRSNQEIADARQVSAHTIAKQLRSIYEKLGVGNRSELARMLTRERN